MKIPQSGKILLATALLFLSNAPLLMAQPDTQLPDEIEKNAPEKIVPQTFEADGSPLEMSDAGIIISPPAGWMVRTQTAGMTMIMHEKEKEQKVIDYSKPLFRRNITLTTRHEPVPIDEKTVAQLQEGMSTAMEKSPLASDFQIIEHRFFDYKAKNDGVILYTQLTLGKFPMMQMHVLISGEDRHYLLSYTDLASEFQSNEAAFQAAWNTMTTVEVAGQAPVRYRDLIIYSSLGGGVLLVVILLIGLRRRANRKAVAEYSDRIYEDDDCSDAEPISTSGVWVLDSRPPENQVAATSAVSSFY